MMNRVRVQLVPYTQVRTQVRKSSLPNYPDKGAHLIAFSVIDRVRHLLNFLILLNEDNLLRLRVIILTCEV